MQQIDQPLGIRDKVVSMMSPITPSPALGRTSTPEADVAGGVPIDDPDTGVPAKRTCMNGPGHVAHRRYRSSC